jgi:hypothetical protein
MSLQIIRDFGLLIWMSTGLFASLATGSIVGVIISTPLRTYQIMMSMFFGGAITWIASSFVSSAMARLLLEVLIRNQFLLFGILATVGTIGSLFVLTRLHQNHRGLRWAMLGSLSAWLTVAIGTVTAYGHFLQVPAGMADEFLPRGFWPCIMFSMAISTILGACLGGMVFRQRQIWRQL